MTIRRTTLCAAVIIGALVIFKAERIDADGTDESAARRIYWADVSVSGMPEVPELLALGKTTYGQRCVGCHGQNGLGNGPSAAYMLTKPRDFSKGEFKLRTTMDFPTDEDLFGTITVGFPAYGMPSFAYLPERQRWALVYYVKQLGREGFTRAMANTLAKEEFGSDLDGLTREQQSEFEARIGKIHEESADIAGFRFEPYEIVRLPKPMPATEANVARGKEVYYEMECNVCHGDTGHGDGTSAQGLTDNEGRKIWPRDFALNGWYFKGGDRPQDIFRILLTGMPGTPMPSFDMGSDSHKDLWHLSHYIEKLASSE